MANSVFSMFEIGFSNAACQRVFSNGRENAIKEACKKAKPKHSYRYQRVFVTYCITIN